MGRSNSPIFWRKGNNVVSRQINNYLVDLSHSLIEQAAGSADFENDTIEQHKNEIGSQIAAALKQPVGQIAIDGENGDPSENILIS
jgi:hypothetical protein